MYVAVDIGGTKTLVALLSADGQIQDRRRFPTNPDYQQFLCDLKDNFEQLPTPRESLVGCAGVPGLIEQQTGIVKALGNLPWRDKHIRDDIAVICHTSQFMFENDARLAGLSEAMLHKDKQTVLYITVSTGIGIGFIRNQRIEPALLKSEGGHMVLPHDGKLTDWEAFASGHAIATRYGKPASEITDQDDWRNIAHNLALGFFNHIAILQPDLIVVGGSIGAHFDHYSQYLFDELKTYETPMIAIPPIIKAQRPEEAVLFGCYDAAKQAFGDKDAGTA